MELALHQSDTSVQVADKVFGATFNEALIHQAVVAYMAGGRAGTKAQKTRSEVRGGGSKPWRQKGTGRARAGTIRSPIWRGGGKVFAAKPRDYTQKLNKKMYRAALRSIVSELLRQSRLLIVAEPAMDAPKTRDMVAYLKKLEVSGSVLIVVAEESPNLWLAARNLHKVEVCTVSELNPVSLIKYEQVVMGVDALKQFDERLAA